MENLIKQTRLRFAGTGHDNKEDSSTKERKTRSFPERKRSQSWIRRQFSRQMSWDYDANGIYYTTAVAAAAFAIQSLPESKPRHQRDTAYIPDKSSNTMKIKLEYAGVSPEPHKNETSKTSLTNPDIRIPVSMSTSNKRPEKAATRKKISFAETDESTDNKPEKPAAYKSREAAPPSMRRPPTYADQKLNIADIKKPTSTVPNPNHSSMGWSTTQPVQTRKQTATEPGPGDSQAIVWEREEMASIKERYENLRATIENWEAKKKKKATRKIERTEAELDKNRAKARKSYRSEIKRIEDIAGGARAQAEENRRKEEFKVKDRANKIRLTGKLPATCLCF